MWARRGGRWGWEAAPPPPAEPGERASLGCVQAVLGRSSAETVLPQAELQAKSFQICTLNTIWSIRLLKDALINDR